MSIDIRVQLGEQSVLPVYSTDGAAGADLYAAEDAVILPGDSALISTNLCMEIPEGFELQIRPRSGLALKHQVTVLNSPGTIDSDYRVVVGVILINHGKSAFGQPNSFVQHALSPDFIDYRPNSTVRRGCIRRTGSSLRA